MARFENHCHTLWYFRGGPKVCFGLDQRSIANRWRSHTRRWTWPSASVLPDSKTNYWLFKDEEGSIWRRVAGPWYLPRTWSHLGIHGTWRPQSTRPHWHLRIEQSYQLDPFWVQVLLRLSRWPQGPNGRGGASTARAHILHFVGDV